MPAVVIVGTGVTGASVAYHLARTEEELGVLSGAPPTRRRFFRIRFGLSL
ncbi:MAG TPA: hypothetical protein VMS98_08640 [Thermoanaerobaculia bacterium]|nr:hypothetical protein [Thermoanaerobaculia bacterium]